MTSEDSAAPKKGPRRGLTPFLRLLYVIVFLFGIYFSGSLGIKMAKERLPQGSSDGETTSSSPGTEITLGATAEPVYLAESPEALRRFFTNFSSPGTRASADLSDLGIRRINAYLLATIRNAESDAVEVTINSGAIAGTVYWVHHTQIPDRTVIDPVISPVPLSDP